MFLKDLTAVRNLKIRGLEVNGKPVILVNKKGFQEHSVNLSDEETGHNNITDDSAIIPMESVHSIIGYRFSKIIQTTAYILPLSLLSLLLLIAILVSIGVCRYLRLRKGSYYTEEVAGDTQSQDADTAVLQGKTGNKVERRKEWIL